MQLTQKNKCIFTLIVIFPIIYIWFAIITRNSAMRIFYFIYSLAIALLIIFDFRKKKCKMRYLFVSSSLTLLTGIFILIFSDAESISNSILLLFMLFYLYLYSDKRFREEYFYFLIRYDKQYTICICLYYIAIGVSLIIGVGISYGWGTTSLQGPYGLAHIFSYELLLLSVNCYLLFVGTKRIKWIIILGLNLVLIVLTNVRTTLLCLLCIILYYFITRKDYKKILLFILGLVILWWAYNYTPIFNTVIEKTMNAVSTGDITNARLIIWEKSISMFTNSDLIHKLLGNGMGNLMNYNLINTNMKIHAHNEFIDIITANGIVAFIVFIYLLNNLSSGSGKIGFLLAYGVLAWFNGIYGDCSFVMGLISFRLLFEKINFDIEKRSLKKRKENSIIHTAALTRM